MNCQKTSLIRQFWIRKEITWMRLSTAKGGGFSPNSWLRHRDFCRPVLARIIHKSLLSWGGDVWSSPSIAGQERENERVSFEKGDGLKNPPLLSVNSPPDPLSWPKRGGITDFRGLFRTWIYELFGLGVAINTLPRAEHVDLRVELKDVKIPQETAKYR